MKVHPTLSFEHKERKKNRKKSSTCIHFFLFNPLPADGCRHSFFFPLFFISVTEEASAKMSLTRVLITGASGLVGRLFFNHLNTQIPLKYDVYGLDITTEVSSRYELEKLPITESDKQKTAIPQDRFVHCDVTDREKLHRILSELKIDIVIHLAVGLPIETDVNKVLRVNVEGTRNVFEARKLRMFKFYSYVPEKVDF